MEWKSQFHQDGITEIKKDEEELPNLQDGITEINEDEEELPNLSDEQMLEADNLYKTLQKFELFKNLRNEKNILLQPGTELNSFSFLRHCLYFLKTMMKNKNNGKKIIAHYLLNNKDAINKYYGNIKHYIIKHNINIGGKPKAKSKKNKISQKKQSEYKEILGKKMKIYKMPDSRKQYVRYKGELHSISDYKNLMKQKAAAKAKK
jgi:hypothetical protein